MTCPWLSESQGKFWCTAVSPHIALDFTKPSQPNVNGDICKLPEPEMFEMTHRSHPWAQCKRWRPDEKVEESALGEKISNIDRRIIYLSVILFVFASVFLNFTTSEFLSTAALAFVVILIIANIGYILSRLRGSPEHKKETT
jgi:hypothetical protein